MSFKILKNSYIIRYPVTYVRYKINVCMTEREYFACKRNIFPPHYYVSLLLHVIIVYCGFLFSFNNNKPLLKCDRVNCHTIDCYHTQVSFVWET